MNDTIRSNLKKCQQINNLKSILTKSNKESLNLIKKVYELHNIFKNIKKINNEKIKKIQKTESTYNKNELKQQICNELKEIIMHYKNKNSISSKNAQYQKDIKEKNNQINILLNKFEYNKLKKENDLLIQAIQEKKDICKYMKKIYEERNNININTVFELNNYNYFENIYDVKIDNFRKYKKYKEFLKNIKSSYINNEKVVKENGVVYISEIKKLVNIKNQKKDKYIADQEFNCFIKNNKYKKRYNLEIDLLDQINNSSESESDESDESDSIIDLDSDCNIEQSINKNKNLIDGNKISKEFECKIKKNKKISITSSEKETNDGDNDINNKNNSLKNNNISLINKLVEIKERYNKLMNEKYELEKEKIPKKQKIMI
jgi:hypothetical protein